MRRCARACVRSRRCVGYRRIGLILERGGLTMNHKKLRRLYKEEGLAVKRRRGRKRATGTREPMPVPYGPTKRWGLDFVADVFGPARRSPYSCKRRLHARVLGAGGGYVLVRRPRGP